MLKLIFKILSLSIALTIVSTSVALSQESGAADPTVYLNVGKASLKKSNLAFPPISFLGTGVQASGLIHHGKTMYEVIKKDLEISSYFDFIDQRAFLEDVSTVSMRPKDIDSSGFSFEAWSNIGAEFLIRSGYKIANGQIILDAYVYYVPQRKLIFSKSFSASTKEDRTLAHTFANFLVEKLTGKKGIFLTKIIAAKSTNKQEKEIYVMDWDGYGARPVTSHKSISISPAWSPDGRFVAYTSFTFYKKRKGRNADLYLYDLRSNKRWILSNRPGINSSANFFPNSDKVLFRLSNNGTSDIYMLNIEGKNLTPITNGPRGAMNVEPSVSPDGKKIAFSSDRGGKEPMIYIMNTDGTNVKRITFAGKYNSCPSWSPDGKQLVFQGHDTDHFDVFIINADGSSLARLTTANRKNGTASNNENPTFSPDGRHILFSSDRTGNYQLYVVNPDGSNEHRITFDNSDYDRPQWSPYLN